MSAVYATLSPPIVTTLFPGMRPNGVSGGSWDAIIFCRSSRLVIAVVFF